MVGYEYESIWVCAFAHFLFSCYLIIFKDLRVFTTVEGFLQQ
jgi:hypothetical protein